MAAIGTWISNPFTYVPLYYFNYRVGSLLLNKDQNIVDISHITTTELWSQGLYLSSRLLTGSICVGFVTAFIGGLFLYIPLKKFSNTI